MKLCILSAAGEKRDRRQEKERELKVFSTRDSVSSLSEYCASEFCMSAYIFILCASVCAAVLSLKFAIQSEVTVSRKDVRERLTCHSSEVVKVEVNEK